MNKNLNGIIAIVLVCAILYGAYKLSFKNKRAMVSFIVAKGRHASKAVLMTFDDAFIKEWYKGAKANKDSFTFAGKKYNTQGGTAVK